MAISLNNLNLFVSVCDNDCNMSATAQALYISQPAISKAIKNIEDELNVSLFIRNKRSGMMLTPVGERLLKQARSILSEANKLYQIAEEENKMLGGILRIAAIPLSSYPLIAKSLKVFKTRYPRVNVTYTEMSNQQVKEAIDQYSCDLGIAVSPFSHYESLTLYDDAMIALSLHPLNDNVFDFSSQPHAIVCQSGLEAIVPVLEDNHINTATNFETLQTASTVKVLLDQDLGTAILSRSFIQDLSQYYYVETKPPIPTVAAIIYNQYDMLSPAAKAFIDIVKEVLSQNE